MQIITPSNGTSGLNGRRKGRGISGCVHLNTMTPLQTKVNAASVPILTNSAARSIGAKPAMHAIRTPINVMMRMGVRVCG